MFNDQFIIFFYFSFLVSSVKAPGSMKRQNSISFDSQPQPSSNRPATPMDSNEAGQPIPTPKPPPSVSRKVVADPTLRKGTCTWLHPDCTHIICHMPRLEISMNSGICGVTDIIIHKPSFLNIFSQFVVVEKCIYIV